MTRILIADDDANLRYSFQRMLAGRGYEIREAGDGHEAIAGVLSELPDVVVLDIKMPGMDGLEAFEQIKRVAPDLPVIIMTAFGTTETAIEAMKRGAFDYIRKPFKADDMHGLLTRAVRPPPSADDSVSVQVQAGPESANSLPRRLIGGSKAMQEVYKTIGQVAESGVHILVLGESGTGKELVARALHEHSTRRDRPLVAINCAAVPDALIESELFGHEKGAFTGALRPKAGLLQANEGGTLLLDEIGDMPLPAQAKLLRFLQEGEVLRVGSDLPVKIDVRVIAASNKNLDEAVERGDFRADLLYRLNSVAIELPPLRERIDDLDELVPHFVDQFNREFGKRFTKVTSSTMSLLRGQPWPGNVRQLENTIRKAVLTGQGTVLLPDHVLAQLGDRPSDSLTTLEARLGQPVETIVERLVEVFSQDPDLQLLPTLERLFVEHVLRRTKGNQVQAARMLGISRNTLRSRMERYGLTHAAT